MFISHFAVLFSCGGFRAWVGVDAPSAQKAEMEACGIVEAGGNVWEDCPSGFLPDGCEDLGYEVDGVIRVSRFPLTMQFLEGLDAWNLAA